MVQSYVIALSSSTKANIFLSADPWFLTYEIIKVTQICHIDFGLARWEYVQLDTLAS